MMFFSEKTIAQVYLFQVNHQLSILIENLQMNILNLIRL